MVILMVAFGSDRGFGFAGILCLLARFADFDDVKQQEEREQDTECHVYQAIVCEPQGFGDEYVVAKAEIGAECQ